MVFEIKKCSFSQGIIGVCNMKGLKNTKKAVEALEKGDFDTFESLLTDDFLFYSSLPTPLGKRGLIELQRAFGEAIPDWKFNASDYSEAEGKVTYTIHITGTHTGALHLEQMGIPLVAPTGKQISMPQETVTVTLREDKAARVDIPAVPGGGMEGILVQIGVNVPHHA
jgi:hypothetical protein